MPDEIVVHTQDQLNDVLNTLDTVSPDAVIVVEGENPDALRPTQFMLDQHVAQRIKVSNRADLHVSTGDLSIDVDGGEFHGGVFPHSDVHVSKGKATLARGSSAQADGGSVTVRGGSAHPRQGRVTLRGTATGFIDSGEVLAYDNAKVELTGNANAKAYGRAKVDAFDMSTFRADDQVSVRAHGKSTGRLYGKSFAHANDNSELTLVSTECGADAGPDALLNITDDIDGDQYNQGIATTNHITRFDAELPDTLDAIRAEAVQAFNSDGMRAPATSATVQKALEGLPVGDPRNKKIMEDGTSPGWDEADMDAMIDESRRARYANQETARYYSVTSSLGTRQWYADDESHAIEQHVDAFPKEAIISVKDTDKEQCFVCGGWFVDDAGITYHVDHEGVPQPDEDSDHVAYGEPDGAVPPGHAAESSRFLDDSGEIAPDTPELDWDGDPIWRMSEKVAVLRDYDSYSDEPKTLSLDALPGIRPEGTVIAQPDESLYKIGYKDGEAHTVQQFDWDRKKWGRSMTVGVGPGKAILKELESSHPSNRKVPERVAAAYGHATGKCLMCGRGLSDVKSMTSGYGPSCKSKLA